MKKIACLIVVMLGLTMTIPVVPPGRSALAGPLAQGSIYYVAANGVDASANGTAANPWGTITYALDHVPDGSTILVTGETGTGKEVVARAIHHNSPRRAHRFVALNCSAVLI
jgi:hypothetical protein